MTLLSPSRLAAQFLMLLVISLWELPAQALVTDLSKNEVAIETNFTGESVLLFGAIEQVKPDAQDIVVIIKGPDQALTVRRKNQNFGIWINGEKQSFQKAPSYYAVASTRKLSEIAPDTELARHAAGLNNLPVTYAGNQHNEFQEFINGLIRNKQAAGLYRQSENGVQLIGGRLFRAEIDLPPGIPVGRYEARILLFENGKVISQQSNKIDVGISGIEQLLYSWAHGQPMLYGIVGVIISVFCGWGTASLFRRRS